jgi:hypothetical protein
VTRGTWKRGAWRSRRHALRSIAKSNFEFRNGRHVRQKDKGRKAMDTIHTINTIQLNSKSHHQRRACFVVLPAFDYRCNRVNRDNRVHSVLSVGCLVAL